MATTMSIAESKSISISKSNSKNISNATTGNSRQLSFFDLSMIKRTSLSESEDSASSPVPQLDSVTVRTCDEDDDDDDDDDSSVSTLGSTVSSRRRSVFLSFWDKTGQEPVVLYRRAIITPTPVPEEEEDVSSLSSADADTAAALSSSISIARRRSSDASSTSTATASSSSRRSIMPSSSRTGRSYSVPSLPAATDINLRSVRKTQSSLELGATPRRHSSCLREARFSGTPSSSCPSPRLPLNQFHRSDSTSSSNASVSFDLTPEVCTFQIPQERYSEHGWSNYFH